MVLKNGDLEQSRVSLAFRFSLRKSRASNLREIRFDIQATKGEFN